MPASFLLELRTSAEAAKAAETSFRLEAARRIAALEQDRGGLRRWSRTAHSPSDGSTSCR